MQSLGKTKFFNLKTHKSTDREIEEIVETANGRRMAVAHEDGQKMTRFLPSEKKK
jgi:hypothetical protein